VRLLTTRFQKNKTRDRIDLIMQHLHTRKELQLSARRVCWHQPTPQLTSGAHVV